MRNIGLTMAVGMALLASIALPVSAQRCGAGMGMGRRAGMGAGMGARCYAGAGGGYGWWTRVEPKTAQQRAFVARVTELHNQIQAQSAQIASLRAQKNTQKQIAACQKKITSLRAELQKVTRANASLLKEMGVPAGAGMCNGTGPGCQAGTCPCCGAVCQGGICPGCGTACPYVGAGAGRGLRDGSGPNPNCPLK